MVDKERTKEAEKETNRGKGICRTMGYIWKRCREAGLALGASLAIVQGEYCPYCLIKIIAGTHIVDETSFCGHGWSAHGG